MFFSLVRQCSIHKMYAYFWPIIFHANEKHDSLLFFLGVIQSAIWLLTISPSPSWLLVIACHWFGHGPVCNKPRNDRGNGNRKFKQIFFFKLACSLIKWNVCCTNRIWSAAIYTSKTSKTNPYSYKLYAANFSNSHCISYIMYKKHNKNWLYISIMIKCL